MKTLIAALALVALASPSFAGCKTYANKGHNYHNQHVQTVVLATAIVPVFAATAIVTPTIATVAIVPTVQTQLISSQVLTLPAVQTLAPVVAVPAK